jgi:hypothetical protein
MADAKLTDLPAASRAGSNPPTSEDWLYMVDRHATTDSAEGSSRKVSSHEYGLALVRDMNLQVQPGGRLTLVSGTPVADSAAATTLYYTPYLHDTIPLWYDPNQRFDFYRFKEKSLPLGTLLANKNYDVFASYSGDPTLRASSGGTLNASSAVTLPTRSAGDMLVVVVTAAATAPPVAGSGWVRTGIGGDGSTHSVGIYTKLSDGVDATGPLGATMTGVYSAFSVTNGTWADVLLSTFTGGTGTALTGGAPLNYNPVGVWIGGWGWNSSTATLTTSGYTAGSVTSPNGNQTFPSGSGRMYAGYQTLAGAYNETPKAATLSASAGWTAFGISVVGGLKLEAVAWTGDTTRNVAISAGAGRYQDDLFKRTYLGTFRTITTTQTIDNDAQRFLWNMYNKERRRLWAPGAAVAVYSYTTTAWRQVAAQTNQKVEWVQGLTMGVHMTGRHRGYAAAGGGPAYYGIAFDSISSPAGMALMNAAGGPFDASPVVICDFTPVAGYHYCSSLEYGGTITQMDPALTGNGLWGFIDA